MRLGKIYGVGLGPGDPGLLTLRALEVLRSCGKVFEVVGARSRESVSGRLLDAHGIDLAKRVSLLYTMDGDKAVRAAKIAENAAIIAKELRDGADCAFATIGDPLIYSTFSYTLAELRKLLPSLEAEAVPGVTSFQTAAARACMPIVEDEESLLLSPCHKPEGVERAFSSGAESLALLKAFKTKGKIMECVQSAKGGARFVYASRLGLEDELVTDDPKAAGAAPETYLSLFLVKRGAGGNG